MRLSLLKLPPALSSLGFRVGPGDTPCPAPAARRLKRSVKRPRLRSRDRLFRACLSRLWKDWRSGLILVKPETVIRWHQRGFRLFRRWKSRAAEPGHPCLSPDFSVGTDVYEAARARTSRRKVSTSAGVFRMLGATLAQETP